MPRFTYVALDGRGQESTGLVEAGSSNEAIGQLRQAGYFPTSVYEESKGGGRDGKSARATAKAIRAAQPRERKNVVLVQRKKVKPKVLMIFRRQLATLIEAGLPLLRSLNVLAKQERDAVLKRTINKLADGVQGGNTFSDALSLHPPIFNDLYVNMVKAGELGGVLEVVLNRLAEFQEKAAKIKNRVKSAMVYPVIVISMAFAIMAFLLVFIVPKFEAIFHDMLGNKPLPAITTFVINLSKLVQPLEASRAFPPMVISMIDVGEETGQLPEMLLKIANVYDDEVDNAVAGITAALEPIMIVILAFIVGTIVLALFTPLISIIQGLQQQT